MGFVNDERVILSQERIIPCFRKKDPVRHELHAGHLAIRTVFEANLVSDLPAQLHFQLFRDATRHGGRGNSTGLGAADPFSLLSSSHFQDDFRKLGGLSRAGVTAHDHDGMTFQARPDIIPSSRDRQVLWKKKFHAVPLMNAGGHRRKGRTMSNEAIQFQFTPSPEGTTITKMIPVEKIKYTIFLIEVCNC
jgi:hypothetical protein